MHVPLATLVTAIEGEGCWVEVDFSSDRSSCVIVCAISWIASFEVLCPLEDSAGFCFLTIVTGNDWFAQKF